MLVIVAIEVLGSFVRSHCTAASTARQEKHRWLSERAAGLGFAIVFKVAAHGGTLQADRAPAQRTAATLNLPLGKRS